MTGYCGVDFHACCQTVSYCDTADGEVHQQELHPLKDEVRAFYQQFSGEVIVGLETGGARPSGLGRGRDRDPEAGPPPTEE